MRLIFPIATLSSLAYATATATTGSKVDRSLRGVAASSSKHQVRSLQGDDEFFVQPPSGDLGPDGPFSPSEDGPSPDGFGGFGDEGGPFSPSEDGPSPDGFGGLGDEGGPFSPSEDGPSLDGFGGLGAEGVPFSPSEDGPSPDGFGFSPSEDGPSPDGFGFSPSEDGPSPDGFGFSPSEDGPSPSLDGFGPGGPDFVEDSAPFPPGAPGPAGTALLGPGESNCIPHPSNDGTLFCGFRTQFGVGDVNTNSNTNTHLSCVTDSNLGYQYCANIGLYLQPDPNGALPPPPGVVGPGALGSLPGFGVPPIPPFSGPSGDLDDDDIEAPLPPPPPMGVPGFVHPPNVGCPMIRPAGGNHCGGWIPGDAMENRCHYEGTMCLCESLVYGWQCNAATLSSLVVDPNPLP